MKPLHILHLEDNPYDAEFVQATLEAEGITCSITRVCNRGDFVAALEPESVDLIISDYALPSFDGMAALGIVRAKWPGLPFILVSGTVGEEFAIDSLKSGATDYVLKQRLSRLVPAVRRAMKEVEQRAERQQLEEQFFRSQRMESIGALAGGIAHDLNNALVPILVGTQLLQQNDHDEAERKRMLEMICGSAQRCSQMVKQILTFARGARSQIGPLQVRHLIEEMLKIAGNTFPKSISIYSNVSEELWTIKGEATELHQVLMNLCVNARDAMPRGGQLTLSSENVVLSAEALQAHPDVAAGPYVLVRVADTGAGIPAEIISRIFEPFFTTKTHDKGTGLGLSTVVEIIKRHKGFVQVQSEVGKGTEFKLYLPVTASTQMDEAKPKETPAPMGHGELILIVDDEQAVIEMAKTALESYGYHTLTALNGLEAVTCFQTNKGKIRVLLTDTDMPFLNGMNMIRDIQKIEPTIPIIVASGGKRDPEQFQLIDTTHLITLSKPYDVEQLLNGVMKALNISVRE